MRRGARVGRDEEGGQKKRAGWGKTSMGKTKRRQLKKWDEGLGGIVKSGFGRDGSG